MTPQLTHNIQAYEIAAHRLRGYLALVHPGVPLLSPLYLQGPVLGVLVMGGLEPLVGGVGVRAHRQYVDVAVPNPGHLQNSKTIANICTLAGVKSKGLLCSVSESGNQPNGELVRN